MKKRGQVKLSFGMIFSIILIVAFIAFAVYAILKFLDLQDDVSIAKFRDNLQDDVDRLWASTRGSEEISYRLPKDIEFVCFMNYESNARGRFASLHSDLGMFYTIDENMFFYSSTNQGRTDSARVNHLDLDRIVSEHNPFCVGNEEGKVTLTLSKNYGDELVLIE